MGDGDVDRQEWAAIVRELLAQHTKGKKATFARKVGVDPKTIDHWLEGRVRVSESSVRQVAKAVDLSPIDLLIRVGVYTTRQVPQISDEIIDEEERAVLDDPDLSDEEKAEIIATLESWKQEDDQLLQQLAERDKQRRTARLAELIARMHRSA